MKKFNVHFLKSFFYSLALLGVLFLPSPLLISSYQEKISSFIFEKLISYLKPCIFKNSIYNEISSDSSSLYILFLILIIIALIAQIAIIRIKKIKHYLHKIIQIIIPYYVCFILLKYGIDKVFMNQFYEPQTNLLYTPLGFLDKDILFWSTLGIAPIFNLFLGISQIITALLLFFRNTRFLGFLLSVLMFISIVVINLSFDISVKLFSFFLLFLSITGLIRYNYIFIKLYNTIKTANQQHKILQKNKFLYAFIKSFTILVFMFLMIYNNFLSINTQNANHNIIGAYLVTDTKRNDTLIKNTIKRIFIHKDDYMIFQNLNDEMNDFKLENSTENNQFIITDYNLKKRTINYTLNDSLLLFHFSKNKNRYQIFTKKLNHKSLPLLKHNFHWTIDDIQ